MAIKTSTGLRNGLLVTASLADIMGSGVIKIYSGAVPATADAAATGTLLVTISNDSDGSDLFFSDVAVAGAVPKDPTQIWSGVNVAGGVATYYRHVDLLGDDGTASTTQKRIQGLVGNVGSDMNLTNTTLVTGATQTVDYYQIYLPTL